MSNCTSYSAWSEQCRALLEIHSNLDAICICDHGSRVLGSAFKNSEFAEITNLSSDQVRTIKMMIIGEIDTRKTTVDFLSDRFVIIDTNNESLTGKCGRKCLFVVITKTLYVFGLTMDTENEQKYVASNKSIQEIQKYYENVDF